jgi:hypothetical protein
MGQKVILYTEGVHEKSKMFQKGQCRINKDHNIYQCDEAENQQLFVSKNEENLGLNSNSAVNVSIALSIYYIHFCA